MAKAKTQRKAHDMGGERAGPVDRTEHVPTLTERRIDAMMLLLRNKPRAFWVTDENRRTIESLTPDTYRGSGYYEKWAYSMRSLLVEKGVLTQSEIEAKLVDVRKRLGLAESKTLRAGKPKSAAASRSKPATGTAGKSTVRKPKRGAANKKKDA